MPLFHVSVHPLAPGIEYFKPLFTRVFNIVTVWIGAILQTAKDQYRLRIWLGPAGWQPRGLGVYQIDSLLPLNSDDSTNRHANTICGRFPKPRGMVLTVIMTRHELSRKALTHGPNIRMVEHY